MKIQIKIIIFIQINEDINNSSMETFKYFLSEFNKVKNEKENCYDDLKKMSYMFYGCLSLISLPDISKYNTNNVNFMNNIFYECSSLISLQDISKWNTNNVKFMNNMFSGCSSLISLPDISKLKTNNVKNMSAMFSGFLSFN